MSFEMWLAQIDPSRLSFAAIVVLGSGVFVWRKVWPWAVEIYFPARLRRLETREAILATAEQTRTETFAMMRDTLVELKTIAETHTRLLESQSGELRTLTSALLELLTNKVGNQHGSN
jgi:hypothetical protein